MSLEKRICPECQKEFERQSWDLKKYEKKEKIPCCSRSCSTKISNRKRNQKRLLVCLSCKSKQLVNETDSRKFYCSRKCYFECQKEELAERARQLGKDKAQQISETKKKMYRENPECHGRLSKKHSKETKELLSKQRNKYFETHDGYWKNKKFSEEMKNKISATRAKRWANGEYDHIKMAWAKGKYFFQKAGKEVWYRSSWELAYMKYLDSREDIISCEYEGLKISYHDLQNKKRYYIPDFLVEHESGKKVLYEVKPFLRKDSETNKRKFKAARKYCKENNMKFKVITERYLKHIGCEI